MAIGGPCGRHGTAQRTASTRPEAVRISRAGQGDRGIILDDFSLRFNDFDKYAVTKR